MENVSTAFIEAIEQNAITDKVEGTITLTNGTVIPFNDENIKQGTLAIDNQCINSEELEFGCVYAGQISFQLDSDISRYAVYDAKIEISYFLKVGDDFEEIEMGSYWVTEAVRQGQYLKITGLDAMAQMDNDFDDVAVMDKPFEVLKYISDKTGVPFENTQAEIEAMVNGKTPIQIDKNSSCETWRDCVAIVAQILAGFGTATRTGGFKICQFSTKSCYSVPYKKHTSTEIADFECSYAGLKVTVEGTTYESYADADDGLVMSIENNILFYTGNEKGTQTKVDAVKNVLCNIKYIPSTVSMASLPFVECGDMLTYTVDGNEINSILTSYVWNYRGKSTYKAAGKNPRLTSAKTKADKQTSTFRQTYDSNKIVFLKGTNATEKKIDSKYAELLRFNITSVKETNVIFLAEILVDVTTETEEEIIKGKVKEIETITAEDGTQTETEIERDCYFTTQKEIPCEVNFKYKISQVEIENYHPTEQLTAGRHILTLLFVLPDMPENSTIRFSVDMNCSSGSLTIQPENIKSAVIGQGLNAYGTESWDGNIDLTDEISTIAFRSGKLSINKLTDTVSIPAMQVPKSTVLNDDISVISMKELSLLVSGIENETYLTDKTGVILTDKVGNKLTERGKNG